MQIVHTLEMEVVTNLFEIFQELQTLLWF